MLVLILRFTLYAFRYFMTSEIKDKMEQSLTHLRSQLAKLHTGRAHPGLIEELQIEAYEGRMRLMELATISAPQPSLLMVQPWDQSVMPAINHAIEAANLGFTPHIDGEAIRIAIPPLSQERRQQLIKLMHGELEEAKVAMRQLRHEERESIQRAKKDGDLSEDEAQRMEKELQVHTDKMIEAIETLGKAKEQELLEI